VTRIHVTLDGETREIAFDKLVMAGYTGRDQTEVRAHVAELAAHGIPAPPRVPMLYACAPSLLTTADEIAVLGRETSGEAEFVLLPAGGGDYLVAVGSDHTDRALEASDIPRAKQLCAKPISRQVWRLAELLDRWDELFLRAWVGETGPETLYQEGPLARMMRPADILTAVAAGASAPTDDAVIFSGTLATLGGGFRPAPFFVAELADPQRRRTLRCTYRARVLDYLI